jgi:Ca2+-binding RTX toxin-like protein
MNVIPGRRAPTFAGGNDTIDSGAGQDIIIGGRLDDTVNAGDGDNVVIGDSGRIRAADADTVQQLVGLPMTIGWITTIQPDDGLIKTSRNDLVAEPLHEIDALEPDQGPLKNNETVNTNSLNAEISTPGNIQRAIINVAGALKKTVDLLSFDAGLANGETLGVNDIIYGGLNDDSIHAGAGDDAVSGGEALPFFYTNDSVTVDSTTYTANELLQIQQQAPVNPGIDNAEEPFWFDFAPYNPGASCVMKATLSRMLMILMARPSRNLPSMMSLIHAAR